ncbi:hypothetical protein [Microcoleus sp. D2_18a_B4]|uniref:hypothetical protein n=1 Tax=Microcoleus sp. D2_18a_B4 TaxID=3055329 RepID=UPI002FD6E6B6
MEKHLGLTTRRGRCFFLCLNKEGKPHRFVDYKQGAWKREHLTFAAKLEIGIRSQESGVRRKEEEGRRKEP